MFWVTLDNNIISQSFYVRKSATLKNKIHVAKVYPTELKYKMFNSQLSYLSICHKSTSNISSKDLLTSKS